MINVSVKCRVCDVPMTLEVDDSLPANEKFLHMATCDRCLIRMGRQKREPEPRESNLPYAD